MAELIGRILRWFAHRRGSPAHQRHLIRFLRRGSDSPGSLRLRGHQHPSEHAVHSQHPRKNVLASRAMLDRVYAITIPSHAASPIIHLHPFSGTIVGCDSEGPDPRRTFSALATVVRYRRRGARAAGYRGRGTCAGRVDHASASSPWTGARRSTAEYPACCYSCAVAQGVRARGRRHKGYCYEDAGEVQMSSLAASGALPIVRYVCVRLSYFSPYCMPAPVDHIYYNKYNSGWDCK